MSDDTEKDFVERIARIEAKLDVITGTIAQISDFRADLVRAEMAAAQANARIDSIYKIAGLMSTIISVVITLIGRVAQC